MRRIHIVRHRGYSSSVNPIAFSQRRQAERYIESIVKKAWKEATDLEAIGARNTPRIQRAIASYGGVDHAYVREVRQVMASEMDVARRIIDAGYRDFRINYEHRIGALPYIEDVQVYRTLAEFIAR